jgi:hypothetical protein
VSLMGQIYKEAEEVLGWVGGSEESPEIGSSSVFYFIYFWAMEDGLDKEAKIADLVTKGYAGYFLWKEEDWAATRRFFERTF